MRYLTLTFEIFSGHGTSFYFNQSLYLEDINFVDMDEVDWFMNKMLRTMPEGPHKEQVIQEVIGRGMTYSPSGIYYYHETTVTFAKLVTRKLQVIAKQNDFLKDKEWQIKKI